MPPPHRIEVIKDAFGYRPAASVEPHEIGDWLRGLKRKPGTLNRYKSTLSAIYNYGKERKQVKTNPVRDVKHFKVALPNPRFMDDDEETKLRKVVQGWIDSTPERHKLIRLFLREHLNEITVGAGTGIRKANQYGLTWAMLDLKHRLIHLPNTKTGVPHTVPMIDDVYDAPIDQKAIQEEIPAIQRKLERPDGTVASRRVAGDRVFSITENREWFDKAKDEAGIPDLRWHDLFRRTAGSRLA